MSRGIMYDLEQDEGVVPYWEDVLLVCRFMGSEFGDDLRQENN